MNSLDELRNKLRQSSGGFSFSHNNVRYRLDFQVIPEIIEEDGPAFLMNILTFGEQFVCDLFNRYYEQMNPTFFPDAPRKFVPAEFIITTRRFGDDNQITCVSLPTAFDGSILICSGYAFAYKLQGNMPDSIQFFTIEESLVSTNCIGSMTADGVHSNYGSCGSSMDETIEKIAAIAFNQQ